MTLENRRAVCYHMNYLTVSDQHVDLWQRDLKTSTRSYSQPVGFERKIRTTTPTGCFRRAQNNYVEIVNPHEHTLKITLQTWALTVVNLLNRSCVAAYITFSLFFTNLVVYIRFLSMCVSSRVMYYAISGSNNYVNSWRRDHIGLLRRRNLALIVPIFSTNGF